MSTTSPPKVSGNLGLPPTFGALLRITWQHVRHRILNAIHEAGFPEFQEAHFAVFSYPLPDGFRPSELARERKMSRQAVNYLIVQLEGLGYIERRAGGDQDRRLIFLSEKGHGIAQAIFACLRDLEEEWAAEIGRDRFDLFLGVLKELALKAEASDEPRHP